jgi:hypothetical protein
VAAAELSLFPALAGGPLSVEDLARRVGAHPPSTRRLLRALEALGLVLRAGEGFALTAAGREHVPGATEKHDLALVTGAEYLPTWARLAHSVRTGEPAYPVVFGASAWERRAKDPALEAPFQAFLARIQGRIPKAVERAFDLEGRRVVVDVGGGRGGVLAALLAERPGLRGIVFDQPQVVERGLAEPAALLGERIRAVGGSFFESVPRGGDVYLLARVLHDWADEEARSILRAVRAAASDETVLLVVETIVDDAGEVPLDLALRDLHMLAVLGGKERTRDEHEALLASAGFALARVTHAHGVDVLEARPA